MLIMNALDDDQSVVAGGNTFFFKGRQIKLFNNRSIGWSIANTKKECGFVEIPEGLEHLAHLRANEKLEDRASPEEMAIIEVRRKEGVEAYVKNLNALVYNAKVSLTRDLAHKDYKHDPRFEYSEGDVKNMQELIKYQSKRVDEEKLKVDKIKELEKKLDSKS